MNDKAPPLHLPGIILFVHGVNSEGEWYQKAEQALCDGLNRRLNRQDLKPRLYSGEGLENGKPLSRQMTPASQGYSPVIRFYWGYRAEPGKERNWHIPLRNDRGANFWDLSNTGQAGPWYWGGGPFQNGTNNLQQLWSSTGFKRRAAGIDMQAVNTEWDRELHDAPPRTYQAHAAQRLANLIDKIRLRCPRDTVTVMAHSQGTMLALAATALCKTRAPDAVFVMNSPYALQDKITDYLLCGNQRPTEGARMRTFKAIVERIKQDKQALSETQLQQLRVGTGKDGQGWHPGLKLQDGLSERDNHGRLYVYFCPHDRVMGAAPLQSIGWQGVGDKLLGELGATIKQRMLARGMACGDRPGARGFGTLPPLADPERGVKPADFWNGNRRALGMQLWTVPDAGLQVSVNAEQVPDPVTAAQMAEPVGTRTIEVKQGTGRAARTVTVYFDEAPATQDMWGAKWPDGAYKDPGFPFFASIYERQKMMQRDDVYSNTGKRLELETAQELSQRIEQYRPMPTNHSTLPQHAEFMRRVAAYDLPIGDCDAYREPGGFWRELISDADWTSGNDPYYTSGHLQVPPMPPQIDRETVSEAVNKADEEKLKWRGGA